MLGTDGSFSLPLNGLNEKTERNLNNKLINFLKLRTISFDGMDLDSRISSEKSTPSPQNSFPTFLKNFRCFYFCID
jgi:chitinase